MAIFKVKTKNKVDIDKKPRVYFTCHPDDFGKHFKKICDDIFKTRDCAIYYTEDMTEVIADDEKQVDLGRQNLFVVPVTFKLLTTSNRAMDVDIPYALKEHIPVLPIMMESNIDEFYSKPNKFGELQYLNPYSTDLTEISYEEKLKKHLESVLIGEELAKRVRAAFDAYIFLSYRKKDRKYANELMRLIHSNPECRSIAIWFDEFLTPGESFKKNIEKILDDCKLFTLLVTPHLLEKDVDKNGEERDNYVISTELPLARKKKEEKGTDIFAVKMEDTDIAALSALSIEDYVNFSDETFRARLLEAVRKMDIKTNDTPEHNFLIGLAYLDGIDIEVDRVRGIELIQSASDQNLPEAMQKLYAMYYNGIGVKQDYHKACRWAKKLYEYYADTNGEEDEITLVWLNNLALMYDKFGDYQKALEFGERAFLLRSKVLGNTHPATLLSLSNLGLFYHDNGNYKQALKIKQNVYTSYCRVLGEHNPSTLWALNNLAMEYGANRDYETALKLAEKAYQYCVELLGEEHPDSLESLNNLSMAYNSIKDTQTAIDLQKKAFRLHRKVLGMSHPHTLLSLNNLGFLYDDARQYSVSLKIYNKANTLCCQLLGEDHPYSLSILANMACAYTKTDKTQQALILHEKAYNSRCKVLGEYHPDTLISLNNMAHGYADLENYAKATELLEKAYEIACKLHGEQSAETLSVLCSLAYFCKEAEQYDKALAFNEKSYLLHYNLLGAEHPETLTALNNLGNSYYRTGQYDIAAKAFDEAFVLALKLCGENHPYTSTIVQSWLLCISKLNES